MKLSHSLPRGDVLSSGSSHRITEGCEQMGLTLLDLSVIFASLFLLSDMAETTPRWAQATLKSAKTSKLQ
jgi:hypothetical protein